MPEVSEKLTEKDIPRFFRKHSDGKTFRPKIENKSFRFDSEKPGKLTESGQKVLDTNMGFGANIAQIKVWAQENGWPEPPEVYGIDRDFVYSDEIWHDPETRKFTYGWAREGVKQAFGDDVLQECEVDEGDPLDLSDFSEYYFDRVLNLGFAHRIPRKERSRVFRQAYKTLKEDGVLVVGSISTDKRFEDLKKLRNYWTKYWDKIKEYNPDGTRNENLDIKKRERFERSIANKIPHIYGTWVTDSGDIHKLDSIAANSDFHITGLNYQELGEDLHDAGYSDVMVERITPLHPRPFVSPSEAVPLSIFKYLIAYAKK